MERVGEESALKSTGGYERFAELWFPLVGSGLDGLGDGASSWLVEAQRMRQALGNVFERGVVNLIQNQDFGRRKIN